MNYLLDLIKSFIVGCLFLLIPFGFAQLCRTYGLDKVIVIASGIGVFICISTIVGIAIRGILK